MGADFTVELYSFKKEQTFCPPTPSVSFGSVIDKFKYLFYLLCQLGLHTHNQCFFIQYNKIVNFDTKCSSVYILTLTVVLDYSFGDLCIVEPWTDSYTYTRCYLLLWSALLELCSHACSQLRALYTTWLK